MTQENQENMREYLKFSDHLYEIFLYCQTIENVNSFYVLSQKHFFMLIQKASE